MNAFAYDVSAEVVAGNAPIEIGNPASGTVGISSTLPDDVENEFTSRAWDNFTISQEVSITSLQWLGAYNGLFNPNEAFRGQEDFRIEFFPNMNNAPNVSSSIASFELDGGTAGRNDGTDVTVSIVPNQSQASGGAIVDYQADLDPFTLQPGEYWLSIQSRQTFPSPFPALNPTHPDKFLDPSWSWVLSKDDDTRFFSFDEQFGDISEPGQPFGFDTAFTLIGEPTSVTLDGDFDEDGDLTVADLDLLAAAIRGSETDTDFDLDQDGDVDESDHRFWVTDIKGTLPGDADLDGRVAFADFLRLSQNFGLEGGWGQGNFNTDEVVNFADFLTMSQNFGRVSQPASAAGEPPLVDTRLHSATSVAAVPEPATWAGFAVGMIVLLGGTRRSRRTV